MFIPPELWAQIVEQLPLQDAVSCKLLCPAASPSVPPAVADAAFWAAALDGEVAVLDWLKPFTTIPQSRRHVRQIYAQSCGRNHFPVILWLDEHCQAVIPPDLVVADSGNIFRCALASGNKEVILHVSQRVKWLHQFVQKEKMKYLTMAIFSKCPDNWSFFWLLTMIELTDEMAVKGGFLLLRQMAACNNVALLQWMFDNHQLFLFLDIATDVMVVAAEYGSLQALQWLVEKSSTNMITVGVFKEASRKGHTHVLRWLFQVASAFINNQTKARVLLIVAANSETLRYLEIQLRDVMSVDFAPLPYTDTDPDPNTSS